MVYALIEDGIVTNMIWLYPGNAGDFPNAVSTDDLPVTIGDAYDGEHFYRDGVQVISEMERMQAQLADAQTALGVLGVTG